MPIGGEQGGSQMLRDANISRVEFKRLEYFFIPVILRQHACLVAVSPRYHTIEIADSAPRNTRALCRIFNVIIRFLIHELRYLPAPRWRFSYGNNPPQTTILACGNFTCMAAKSLAGNQPMDGWTDFGQGGGDEPAEIALSRRTIDDLMHQGGWSDLILPIGNETIPIRHGPEGHSEPQDVVFMDVQGFLEIAHDDHVTRRLVNLLRANTSMEALAAWCATQGFVRNRDGKLVRRMRGHTEWALGTWSDFLLRVEQRLDDIQQGRWP